MKNEVVSKAGERVMLFLKRRSSTILTCIGAAGVVATAVLAVKATPKAVLMIKEDSREKHDGDPYGYTKAEAVRSCWKCYIPATAVGLSTIMCIFGANALNKRQQAALVSAYALINDSYKTYKNKVKSLYGEEAHEEILKSIAVEKAKDVYIYSDTAWERASLNFDDADEEEKLFFDYFSNRYFRSTISKVLQAEYHLNRNYTFSGYASVNDFYEFLGIDGIKGGCGLGWSGNSEIYWIDFNHHKTVMDDGLECYIIDMCFEPTADFLDDYF